LLQPASRCSLGDENRADRDAVPDVEELMRELVQRLEERGPPDGAP
jgi:hypothetical protein